MNAASIEQTLQPHRRLPIGAELQPQGGVHFRVWAPAARSLAVEVEGLPPQPLLAEPENYFAASVEAARAGMRYRYRLDGDRALPDPASRFQPDGPHGPSEIVDPGGFVWSDGDWRGLPPERLVIYEFHVGTFTPAGTWAAAGEQLPALAELGVTCLEMMPVADFPGRFGWGYDGVDLFAPTRLYGRPDDLRLFVDRAHRLGLAVILDVVYNHLGPDGNYLTAFAPGYMTDRYANEWGQALNFDGADAGPVREFFIANAGYWIDEFHFDGLRLDATQQIFDASDEHLLAAIGKRARAAGRGRRIFIASENETQTARIVRPLDAGGYGLDALWNDDFHHAAAVALTGHNQAYYSDFRGTPGELLAAAKHGFLFQGQYFAWQKQPRGTPALDLAATNFVSYIENHDQTANSGRGLRLHQMSSPGSWRAITAYFLLLPAIPMLFQGQEFCSSSPFLYFADHERALAELVKKGRGEFLVQFPSLANDEMQALLADPGDPETVRRCVLDPAERGRNRAAVAFHRDLLRLRRQVFEHGPVPVDGAVIGERAWFLRYFRGEGRDLLLIVNLGTDLRLDSLSEPLLAPVEGRYWRLLWSSESPAYGGGGLSSPVDAEDWGWRLPGQAAILLEPGEMPGPITGEKRRTA
ncbi:MAG: malto-oligosyltrehalose trehalohydrolase [Alphaproteobacteria bacterium]|nr:malto-oligosyltrehalose trehalohydrolase [Alphaproteobacteria bacterium]MBV9552539.1 malto-oligosyltrehalose trehalohydrolase [Alphaproteobacteria bacterium]